MISWGYWRGFWDILGKIEKAGWGPRNIFFCRFGRGNVEKRGIFRKKYQKLPLIVELQSCHTHGRIRAEKLFFTSINGVINFFETKRVFLKTVKNWTSKSKMAITSLQNYPNPSILRISTSKPTHLGRFLLTRTPYLNRFLKKSVFKKHDFFKKASKFIEIHRTRSKSVQNDSKCSRNRRFFVGCSQNHPQMKVNAPGI